MDRSSLTALAWSLWSSTPLRMLTWLPWVRNWTLSLYGCLLLSGIVSCCLVLFILLLYSRFAVAGSVCGHVACSLCTHLNQDWDDGKDHDHLSHLQQYFQPQYLSCILIHLSVPFSNSHMTIAGKLRGSSKGMGRGGSISLFTIFLC